MNTVRPGTSPSLAEIVTALVEHDEAHGRPVVRSQWALADCTCPWPYPLGCCGHIRTTCPHYTQLCRHDST